MTLIGILFALLIERVLSHVREWREHAWFSRYIEWLGSQSWAKWVWETPWGLLLILLAPVSGVALLQGLLHGGVLELLAFAFSVLVLVLCFGPRDLGEEVQAYQRASEIGDEKEMADIAADLGAVPTVGKTQQCETLVTAVLVQGHERILAVLFWFYLLGPVGAVLYRFAAGLPGHLEKRDCSMELHEMASRLHAVLAWLPARAVAGLYMLAGSTDDALANWKLAHDEQRADWGDQTWYVLSRVGCGAMQIEDGNKQPVQMNIEESLHEALRLVRRALLLALGVLAAFTLGGWLV